MAILGSAGELERELLVKKHINNHENKLRLTTFLVVTCVVAATGGLMLGYEIGISGGVSQMDSFLQEFFPQVYAKKKAAKETDYCKFDSQILSAFTSSLHIANLVATFLATSVTKTYGRRSSMLVGSSTFILGALLNGFALNVVMLIFARIMVGFGVGFVNQVVPIYISEVAPAKQRGVFSEISAFFNGIGVLSASLINYYAQKIDKWGWRLSLGCAAIPAFIMLVGALMLPDTPSSLVYRRMDDQGRLILKRLRGTDSVEEELTEICKACDEDKETGHSDIKRLFTERKYLPQLTVGVALKMFMQLCGIDMVAFYAPLLFESVGFGSNASLMVSVVLALINLVSIAISMSVVDRLGRRKLLLYGCIQMFICQVAMAVMMGRVKGTGSYGTVLVVAMGMYTLGFGISWGPLSMMIPSEIFALEVRSAGQGVGGAAQTIVAFVFAQVFLKMMCVMKNWLFLFYAGWLVIIGVFVYFLLPETKGVPLEAMSRVWKEHWLWGRMGSVKALHDRANEHSDHGSPI